MLVVFIGCACLVIGIAMIIRDPPYISKMDYFIMTEWGRRGIAFTTIGALLVLAMWMPIYLDSYIRLVKMEAFYDINVSVYKTNIENTREAIYHLPKQTMVRIDVENLKQSTNWSDRLMEFRDKVVEYNTCIYKLRRYNSSWVLSGLFANPPKRLKLIMLEE